MSIVENVRSQQVPADEIRGSIVAGFQVEGCKEEEDLGALDTFARENGMELFYGGGDAENSEDDHLVSLYPWVVGVEVFSVEGGEEQAGGFEFEPGRTFEPARSDVAARLPLVEAFCEKHGLTFEGPQLYLVARGGLALALLLKGVWIDAPEECQDDSDALYEWLDQHREPAASPGGEVGYRHGTVGSSQEPYPAVVHGICIAGADASSEPVELSAEADAALNARLEAAGITDARYHLITQYD